MKHPTPQVHVGSVVDQLDRRVSRYDIHIWSHAQYKVVRRVRFECQICFMRVPKQDARDKIPSHWAGSAFRWELAILRSTASSCPLQLLIPSPRSGTHKLIDLYSPSLDSRHA